GVVQIWRAAGTEAAGQLRRIELAVAVRVDVDELLRKVEGDRARQEVEGADRGGARGADDTGGEIERRRPDDERVIRRIEAGLAEVAVVVEIEARQPVQRGRIPGRAARTARDVERDVDAGAGEREAGGAGEA